ncbi:hypothetical protein PVIIG_05831 [Plasmodium vivax India VII]|uniref:Uncharacterized protein n=1 Tax=Plasmodium vivax India VII TaxID=1077284 RepID=A0A0J9S425_PLAVI|nr:hypothetical protein PVIIG_05831 [Plasmodium vivax India VII]
MNFCLNYKLTSPAHNETQKLKFYEKLASKYTDRKNTKCDEFLEDFKKLYNDGLKKFYMDGDINLSKELEKYKNLYMKNDLHNYNDLNDLISVQYNLLLDYKEEEQNCLMIIILHQFFQYCNDYKYNRKLSLFMEEFINKYYNKDKSKYQKIRQECKSIPNLNPYCKLYNKLSAEYKNDFSLIEKNSDRYIEQQKKYIEKWSPLDLFILKAKAVFKYFDAMSRILPTILFTMVAIILFFLFI